MKTIALATIGAATLLASAATAAPLGSAGLGFTQPSNIEQVRLVCDQFGRCVRTRGPRYVYRDYDDDYVVRRSYAYGGPRYYDRGYGYGYGGPSIGFSIGSGW